MAWVKVPIENHPIFMAALPKDPRVSTIRMFGGIAAKVNGYMLGGLFARSVMVRLSPEDQRAALALDGAAPFAPMGDDRVMKDTIMLPDDMMDDPAQLRDWLARAIEFTATLPPKGSGKAAAKKAAPRAAPKKAAPRAAPKKAAPKAVPKSRRAK